MKKINVENFVKWIKTSIGTLLVDEYVCCRYLLDDDLAVYMAFCGDFDEDDTNNYQSKRDKSLAICMKIANTKETVWADYEFNDMPYNKDGDVFDTNMAISKNENFEELAEWYIEQYEMIRKLHEQGLLII